MIIKTYGVHYAIPKHTIFNSVKYFDNYEDAVRFKINQECHGFIAYVTAYYSNCEV